MRWTFDQYPCGQQWSQFFILLVNDIDGRMLEIEIQLFIMIKIPSLLHLYLYTIHSLMMVEKSAGTRLIFNDCENPHDIRNNNFDRN